MGGRGSQILLLSWRNILHEAFRWGLRMLGFLCGIAVVLYVLSLFI